MKKRILSLLLALTMLAGIVPVSARAADEPAEVLSFYCDNPLYAAYIPPEASAAAEAEMEAALESTLVGDDFSSNTFVLLDAAVKQLRDAMLRRESSVVLYINYPGSDSFSTWGNDKLFYAAMDVANAEGATDGDYLRWSWLNMGAQARRSGSRYIVTMNLRYYTTYQQEQTAIQKMRSILSGLNLSGMTDYGKASAIHQYVAEHVTYDHQGLAAMNEQLAIHKKENVEQKYFLPFTAYAAVMNGTAVCQGYATMYYALCRLAGLQVRVIASVNHAWNIVRVDGTWYNLDVTADSETTTKTRWFLKGSTTFESEAAGGNHDRVAPYNSAEFQKAYPVGTADYVSRTSYWDVREDSLHIADIEQITKLGLMKGMGSETRPVFAPISTMQRGMLVVVLYRMEKEPEVSKGQIYSDVPPDRYYADAVAWATQAGVVEGDGNGKFRPEDPLTRQELVKVLYGYAEKVKGLDISKKDELTAYTDKDQVAAWALEATRWSVGTEIVKGTTATEISPSGNAKREQLATMLVRFLNYYGIDLTA